MPVTIEGSKGVNGGAAEFKSFTFGVVGDRRNIRATILDGSTSAVFSGDCHILSDGSGGQVLVSNFSLTLNTLLSGVGGMAQGQSVVASGNVAVWHIFNPTNNSQALIATDCTGVKVPEVLGQGLLPAGYTFSALLAVLLIKPDKTFLSSVVVDRETYIPANVMYSASVPGSPSAVVTPISLAGKYHKNCKRLRAVLVASSSAQQQVGIQFMVGPTASVVAETVSAGYIGAEDGQVKSQGVVPVDVSGSYTLITANVFNMTASIYLTGYEI